MSALAQFAIDQGIIVSGSDMVQSNITNALVKNGAKVYIGHNISNIAEDVDLVVFTGAISENNVELTYARQLGIPTMERSQYLGMISKKYNTIISVAGTHGKTTTTSMLGDILIDAKFNPTIHLGGESVRFGNAHIGDAKYFITEACEYRNSFGYLHSDYAIITNIEADHLDYYKTFDNVKNAFVSFANNSKNVIVWGNRWLKNIVKSNLVIVGTKKSDTFFVCNIKRNASGKYSYLIKYKNKELAKISLNYPGVNLVKDSACAFVVAYMLAIDINIISNAISCYMGVKRRFELIGHTKANIPIIADYAHHPKEIESTIKSCKMIYKRIMCVFQPHTYTRTKALMTDFVHCFDGVEDMVVYKTYEARERFMLDGCALTLYDNINLQNKHYFDSATDMLNYVENSEDYDLILVLGAGDIYDYFKNKYSCR
ncbi:MAG: UDP-N-acetylmuramate--L-alanine ligase [Clostridia bacterium]|nr:UDP-N-acetylmuramate--L-alanine ligase [Clostridia bacterium]